MWRWDLWQSTMLGKVESEIRALDEKSGPSGRNDDMVYSAHRV